MTDRPGQQDPPGDSTEVLRRHGRSFYWAGQLLSGNQMAKAAELYSLCRAIDDLADEATTMEQKSLAEHRLARLDQALARRGRAEPELLPVHGQALRLLGDEPLAVAALSDLIAAARQDLQPVRMSDHRQLLQYCYGVAGTVGVMMTCLLQARDRERALPHAIDLGIAMQLTNMARDVLEDAGLGRMYLPAGGAAGGLDPADLVAGHRQPRQKAWLGVCELINRAEIRYASGWWGLHYLPMRARLAIAVAARVYREIGRQILRRGERVYWQQRSVVRPGRKLQVSLAALAQLTVAGRGGGEQGHDATLHEGLITCLEPDRDFSDQCVNADLMTGGPHGTEPGI